MNEQPNPKPEIPPEPGTGRAVRQGRITGVWRILAVSLPLAILAMIAAWFLW